MTYPCWVNGDDLDTINQVVFDTAELQDGPVAASQDQLFAAQDALAAATEILFRLTGASVHGPGMAVDEYTVHEQTQLRRLVTTFKPLREVHRLERVNMYTGDVTELDATRLVKVGNSLEMVPHLGQLLLFGRYRLTYRFGSTVTRGARSILLYYARQLYLAGPLGDPELCQLPDRVTSVTREGVTMALVDPQVFLDKGLTGLIRVDSWVASYANRSGGVRYFTKTSRGSAVYSASTPPPVNIAVWCNSQLPTATTTIQSLQ